jgi:hypothetical protein
MGSERKSKPGGGRNNGEEVAKSGGGTDMEPGCGQVTGREHPVGKAAPPPKCRVHVCLLTPPWAHPPSCMDPPVPAPLLQAVLTQAGPQSHEPGSLLTSIRGGGKVALPHHVGWGG